MIAHIINDLDLSLLQIVEPLTEVSKSNYPDVKLLSILATPSIKAPNIVNTMPIQRNANVTETPRRTKAEAISTPKVVAAPKTEPKAEIKEIAAKAEIKETVAKAEVEQSQPTTTGTANIEYSSDQDLWQKILSAVQEKSAATYAQIKDAGCKIEGNTLTIYTGGGWKMNMIKNRLKIISQFCPSELEISLSDKSLQNDETLADIAELMGGGEEVALSE